MSKNILYVIIAVLLVSLFVSLTNRKEVVINKTTSDTAYIVKIDTHKVEIPIFKYERIVDTIYLEKPEKSHYTIPISQRYYSSDKYQAWVSGFKPSLDSINIYNKTEFVTITKMETKEVYRKNTSLYLSAGAFSFGGTFAPKMGARVKLKNDFMFGVDFGVYDKKTFISVDLNFKINGKRN